MEASLSKVGGCLFRWDERWFGCYMSCLLNRALLCKWSLVLCRQKGCSLEASRQWEVWGKRWGMEHPCSERGVWSGLMESDQEGRESRVIGLCTQWIMVEG